MNPQLYVQCPRCGAKNRVPRERVERGEAAVCGKCREPLPIHLQPLTVTDANFAAAVERSPLPVVVDVWAEWCGPCRMIAPIIDELAREFAGRVTFAKLNLDQNQQTANRYQVGSIPTLLVFRSAQLVDQIVGLVPKVQLVARLQQLLGS